MQGVCERKIWAAGGSQDHASGHTLQKKQSSVLTNQCVGKEAERGAEESC